MEMIIPNKWRNAYHFWATEAGNPILVKPLKYISCKGWNGYLLKKEVNGIIYIGEVWNCLCKDGLIYRYVFRIPYSEDKHNDAKVPKIRRFIEEEVNAHTDGYDAYINNDYSKKNKLLLDNRNIELKNRINHLTKWFIELNNFENKLLKLALQLYLGRLESPTLASKREWKTFSQQHPAIKQSIIDQLKKHGYMI